MEMNDVASICEELEKAGLIPILSKADSLGIPKSPAT
jgi:hypothetical protein